MTFECIFHPVVFSPLSRLTGILSERENPATRTRMSSGLEAWTYVFVQGAGAQGWERSSGSRDAGERFLSFRGGNSLATIVGTKTPGRLLSGSAYKPGHGYILGPRLPLT